MAFYDWLIKQKNRNDIVGDLATDVARDRKFPVNSCSVGKIRTYLKAKGVHEEVTDSLNEAWAEYKESLPSSRRIRRPVELRSRFSILQRDNFRCQTCGAKAPEVRLEVDHKIPVSRGGTNEPSNLWTLCFPCNRGKHAKSL